MTCLPLSDLVQRENKPYNKGESFGWAVGGTGAAPGVAARLF